MNRRRFNQRNIALFGIVIGLVIASSARAQELQIGTGESPLFEGEQLLLNGSYAAAADIFQMADGLDRNEGIVGASRAFFMMGNSSEAINVTEQLIGEDAYADFPLVSTQMAEVKRAIGRATEALEILNAVVDGVAEPPVRTLVQYGSLLKFLGRRTEAEEVLNLSLIHI